MRDLLSFCRPEARKKCAAMRVCGGTEEKALTQPSPVSTGDGRKLSGQRICKPGSVRGDRSPVDGHSSTTDVAIRLQQPTRATGPVPALSQLAPRHTAPIWSCSRWGLPCRRCCQPRGALLPHPFTLTPAETGAVCSLWHYPWGRPRRTLSGTVVPWSPDFPPPRKRGGDRPILWPASAVGGAPVLAKPRGHAVLSVGRRTTCEDYW